MNVIYGILFSIKCAHVHGCKCVIQVILPQTLKGRVWHTSVVIHSSPKIRIICFGGADYWLDEPLPIAQTTMVELCKYNNYNVTLYKLPVYQS